MDNNKKPTLVIMAAGLGSRFKSLKQVEGLGLSDELIIDFSMYDAKRAGFEDVVLIIREEHKALFDARIKKRAGKHMNIDYAFQKMSPLPEGFSVPSEREKPWGTAHAVLSAKDKVHGNFAVINADDYYGPHAFKEIYDYLMAAQDGEKFEYAMVAYDLDKTLSDNGTVSRGECQVSEGGKLLSIQERKEVKRVGSEICRLDDGTPVPMGDKTPVSMNFWGFTQSLFQEIEEGFPEFLHEILDEDSPNKNPLKGEYLLPEVVGKLVDENKADVTVLRSSDSWCGLTNAEDRKIVEDTLQGLQKTDLYPEDLWA